jgi:Dehydrogenases with different specificities (related to short-chain alcohol dehydrogenases)
MHADARIGKGVAVVTGGRRGIGAATALALGREGYAVAVLDLEEDEQLHQTLAELHVAGVRAEFFRANIADVDGLAALVAAIHTRMGPISCLVNNAGRNVAVRGDLLDTTPEAFDAVLNVNLRGTFFLTLEIARCMLASDQELRRSIFVVSSANATMVSLEKGAYCLSKSALPMLTGLYAARLAPAGIDVYEIQPGLIKTDMNRAVWAKYDKAIEEGVSLSPRWGTPEDVATVITSIATGKLPFTTATVIPVGGGLHVHRL